jgi:hypothetical protein
MATSFFDINVFVLHKVDGNASFRPKRPERPNSEEREKKNDRSSLFFLFSAC